MGGGTRGHPIAWDPMVEAIPYLGSPHGRMFPAVPMAVMEAQLAEQLLDDDEDVPTRSFFPESWLWRRIHVAGTARCVPVCPHVPMSP